MHQKKDHCISSHQFIVGELDEQGGVTIPDQKQARKEVHPTGSPLGTQGLHAQGYSFYHPFCSNNDSDAQNISYKCPSVELLLLHTELGAGECYLRNNGYAPFLTRSQDFGGPVPASQAPWTSPRVVKWLEDPQVQFSWDVSPLTADGSFPASFAPSFGN